MFSGIVETIGTIVRADRKDGCVHFTISPALPFHDLTIGDSVAVNGVCLTVTHFTPESFDVSAVPETLRLTNLNLLTPNATVNLERAVTVNQRIGGHHVQGHVDTKGQILDIQSDGKQVLLVKIHLTHHFVKYVVQKGYITLDGMSITVIDVGSDWFTVTFIPHTKTATIVQHYRVGDWINIEVDMIGKYIEKLLGAYTHANSH